MMHAGRRRPGDDVKRDCVENEAQASSSSSSRAGCPWRTSSAWARCTAFPRANGRVWVTAGDVVTRLVQRARAEVARAGGTTTWPGVSAALARRVLAGMCTSWARLGVTLLATVVHESTGAGVHSTQWSVGNTRDMLVHVGEGQRASGHGELMPWSAWKLLVKGERAPVFAGDGNGAVR
jgi:hypothetical protein